VRSYSYSACRPCAEMRAIFRLTIDLTDAERYRDAYHKLLDQVGVLAARNQLAESEANRLSEFNAEILGHNNPAQRIVYLDRVRRELAETKQVRCVFVFFAVVFGTRQTLNVDSDST
jgi:hypothetical protein